MRVHATRRGSCAAQHAATIPRLWLPPSCSPTAAPSLLVWGPDFKGGGSTLCLHALLWSSRPSNLLLESRRADPHELLLLALVAWGLWGPATARPCSSSSGCVLLWCTLLWHGCLLRRSMRQWVLLLCCIRVWWGLWEQLRLVRRCMRLRVLLLLLRRLCIQVRRWLWQWVWLLLRCILLRRPRLCVTRRRARGTPKGPHSHRAGPWERAPRQWRSLPRCRGGMRGRTNTPTVTPRAAGLSLGGGRVHERLQALPCGSNDCVWVNVLVVIVTVVIVVCGCTPTPMRGAARLCSTPTRLLYGGPRPLHGRTSTSLLLGQLVCKLLGLHWRWLTRAPRLCKAPSILLRRCIPLGLLLCVRLCVLLCLLLCLVLCRLMRMLQVVGQACASEPLRACLLVVTVVVGIGGDGGLPCAAAVVGAAIAVVVVVLVLAWGRTAWCLGQPCRHP